MRTALSIAGSDSIGGAGIQADIKAMTAVGVHATTVVTAITAQNTCKVKAIYPIPPEMIQEQLKAVLEDCDVKAIKTGMLYNAETVEVIVDILEEHEVPLIVDPVMMATVGDALSDQSLVRALKEQLLPICELVTPNKYEAEVLAKMKILNEDDAMFACEIIGKQGSSVLLKGGHMDTKMIVDYLYLSSEFTEIKNPRLNKAGHGSGCTLSAYITAHMANGNDLVNSVMKSRELMQEAIASQYDIGKGEAVVNPNVRGGNDKVKYSVLEAVDEAARRLADMIPQELVLRNGINIAYAMPNAAGPEQIAAVDKRMTFHNGMLVKNGEAKLGAAEQLSYVLLEIMKENPDSRCIMNILYTKDTEDIMEEVGFSVSRFNRKKNSSIADMTKDAIAQKNKKVPDAIIDREEKMIRIIGKDPEDVLNKLESVL
jgi:hydroxymethylpyrimidine kinase / phosphomethylpyrimidine kinase / thiamine-phosphate diphosphorylase